MTPETITPDDLAKPGGHYSHAMRAGGFVFVSGQLPVAADGHKLNGEPFEAQARQVLANLAAALRGARSSIAQLVQVRVYVTDIEDWPEFNAIYAQMIGSHRPARTVVPVAELHYGYLVEMDAIAAV